MKTKVNILDYFAYSNYCWYQFYINNKDKFWAITPIVDDDPSDSAWWLCVFLFCVGLNIFYNFLDNFINLNIIFFILYFILLILIYFTLYNYFKESKKSMLKLIKKKSKLKIKIGHICSILIYIISFYCLFTIK